ncbi:hypothetical protein KAS50_08070, partial [bacterium]|nr:hypothetical protein [bacterium]
TSFESIGKLDYSVYADESYRENFLKALDLDVFKKKKMKIVIDYSYGLSAPVFPSLLGMLGCEVISLNAYLDERRLTLNPEDILGNLNQLSTIVTSLKADAGFMINQSAESLKMIDERGQIIHPQILLAILTELYLNTYNAKAIAAPISATGYIDNIASQKNVKVIRTMNSHRAMIDAADIEDVQFVGGTRGGFIYPDFLFACDAMYTVAKTVEMMIKNDIHLGDLIDKFQFPTSISEEITCPKELKGKFMRIITEHTAGLNRVLLDGIKIFDDNGWIFINPHREKSMFNLMVESDKKEEAQKLIYEWKGKLTDLRNTLNTE